jgi:hypothetical protein
MYVKRLLTKCSGTVLWNTALKKPPASWIFSSWATGSLRQPVDCVELEKISRYELSFKAFDVEITLFTV